MDVFARVGIAKIKTRREQELRVAMMIEDCGYNLHDSGIPVFSACGLARCYGDDGIVDPTIINDVKR